MSLSLRITAIIASIAVAFSMAVAFINYHIQLERALVQGTNQVLQMAEREQLVGSMAAYLLDEKLASKIVEELTNNDLIGFAKLSSHTEDLASSGTIGSRVTWVSANLSNPFDEHKSIGNITVEPDIAFIQHQASLSGLQTAYTLIGLSILIAVFVGFFVNLKLTSPLRALAKEFEYVNTAHPDKMAKIDINYNKQDEISKLIEKMNTLIGALQAKFRSEKVLRQTTEELQKQFRLLFEQATAGIALISASGEVTVANPAFKAIFDKGAVRQDFALLFNEPEKVREQLAMLRIDETITQLDTDFSRTKDGDVRYLHCLFSSILDSREVSRSDSENLIEVIVYDVTKRREKELITRYEADHDALTGLLNRRAGHAALQQQFTQAINEKKLFSLMMIDLDNFKPVNDTYGHDAGDIVLKTITTRFKKVIENNQVTLTRWGGDEFLLGVTIDGESSIVEIAEQLLSAAESKIVLDNEVTVQVGASIGIIRTVKTAPQNIEYLIAKADELMYKIKASGRNQYQITTVF